MGRKRHRTDLTVGERRQIGYREDTPTLRRHTVIRLKGRGRGFQVWHERARTVAEFHADLGYIVRRYEQREVEEDAVTEALTTGDPLATCRIGWHRFDNGGWFTLANGGRRGHLIVYWIGPEPVECRCRWIMSMAGTTFACVVCGVDVDADTPTAP